MVDMVDVDVDVGIEVEFGTSVAVRTHVICQKYCKTELKLLILAANALPVQILDVSWSRIPGCQAKAMLLGWQLISYA